MTRLKRFFDNAGWGGAVRIAIVLAFLPLVLKGDVATGRWPYTVAALICPFVLSYLLRDVLVEHVHAAREAMNATLIGFMIVTAVAKRLVPAGELWPNVAAAVFIGGYVGCYFWLMSDLRIAVRR